MKTTPIVIEPNLSNTPCGLATALTTNTAADAGRGFIVSADGSYQLYFESAPTTAITLTLIGGIVYPFAIVKAVFASGTAHNLH